jgi:hypothetical protein
MFDPKANLRRTLLTLALISLTACSPSNNASSPTAPSKPPTAAPEQMSEEGGVNGGGGGTLPANPISTYDVRTVLRYGKRDLSLLLKYFMWSHSLDKTSLHSYEAKIYDGPVTIWDELENTDIELEFTQPCHDSFGNAVDGSVHAKSANAICISPFRIAPKLIKENSRTEILALVLHELSHRLGTTEAEAEDFQKDAAYYLSEIYEKTTAEKFALQAQMASEKVGSEISNLAYHFKEFSADEFLNKLEEANRDDLAFRQVTNGIMQGVPLSVFSGKEAAFSDVQSEKLLIMLWYTLANRAGPEANYWQAQLDRGFQGADTATFKEFKTRVDGSAGLPNMYDNEVLHKIHNQDELASAMMDYENQFSIVTQAIRNLWLDIQMGPMPVGEQHPNPWLAFVGSYEVTESKCSDASIKADETGFKIAATQGRPNDLRIQRIWTSGYGDDGGLYNGAILPSGETAVTVTGDSTSAKRIGETGERWGDSYRMNAFELKQTAGVYTLTKSYLDRRATIEGWRDLSGECVLTLKRTAN